MPLFSQKKLIMTTTLFDSLFPILFGKFGRRFLVLFWLVALVLGFFYAPKFMNGCNATIDPNPGAPSMIAKKEIEKSFGKVFADSTQALYLLYSKEQSNVLQGNLSSWVVSRIAAELGLQANRIYFSEPVSYFSFKDNPVLQASMGFLKQM